MPHVPAASREGWEKAVTLDKGEILHVLRQHSGTVLKDKPL